MYINNVLNASQKLRQGEHHIQQCLLLNNQKLPFCELDHEHFMGPFWGMVAGPSVA